MVENKKVVATIEARMRSTRLPGKVMLPILGRPMLELMIERVRRAKYVDEVVIATTQDPSCDIIEDLAHRIDVAVFRGSEEDVLGRVLGTARSAKADLVVELTGDCPLADPGLIESTIDQLVKSGADCCYNNLSKTLPIGMDVQVFPMGVLDRVDQLTQAARDREHVTIYIYEHPSDFRIHTFPSGLPEYGRDFRLTVDTFEDFHVVRSVYEALYHVSPEFGLKDIIGLLQSKPDLANINWNVVQKKP